MRKTERPKVLIVTEMWMSCDESAGLSAQHHNFVSSLRATGLAEVDTFFLDEYAYRTRNHCDAGLFEHCRSTGPDMLFLKMVRGTDLNPTPEILARICAELAIKIVSVYGDTFDKAAVAWMEQYSAGVDLSVVQDCYSAYRAFGAGEGNYLDGWTPQDPGIFYPASAPPDIRISFVGSTARYPERKLYLGSLLAAGIDVHVTGGTTDIEFPIANYADVMRRSRIALNFSRHVFDEPIHQCKGRVFEATLSGAMLLEQSNPETERWFTPGVHYIPFENQRDLIEKAHHYLDHEDDRQAIAKAGHDFAAENYSAEKYWRLILCHARIQVGAPT